MRLLLFLTVIGLASACTSKTIQQETRKPNVILFLADDLGWADLGYSGSSFYETPNIDAAARSGMIFTNAYAASPVCSPTRSSIMSGKTPARTKNTDWFGAPQPGEKLPRWMKTSSNALVTAPYKPYMALEEYTIAEALRDGGYTTFTAGKWHLGHDEKYWPEHQGFDINKGGYYQGHPPRSKNSNGYFAPYGNPRLTDGPKGEYLPYRLADETTKFIGQNKDKPFFAYFPLYLVHTPLQARKELIAKYQKKRDSLELQDKFVDFGDRKLRVNQSHVKYAAMVEAMDRVVGRVLKAVKEAGIADNTIIIFTADNGGLATNAAPTSNLPLKAGKGWLYEGGIREPMFVIWPGVTAPGSKSDEPVISTDLYPTILEMAGLETKDQVLDGKSFVSVLKGDETFQRTALYWHYPHYSPQGGAPGSVIRQDDWKLIKRYETDAVELYNLKEDLGEQHNLAAEKPEKAQELLKNLDKWLKEVDATFPGRAERLEQSAER